MPLYKVIVSYDLEIVVDAYDTNEARAIALDKAEECAEFYCDFWIEGYVDRVQQITTKKEIPEDWAECRPYRRDFAKKTCEEYFEDKK